jgi:hypothetical protein
VPIVGHFSRRETRTQTRADAIAQVRSGEIWGRTPKDGIEPAVQAYVGPLRGGARGIEFTTETAPHPNWSPFEVRWYLTLTPGVQRRWHNGEEFACILANVTNLQP